MEQFPPEIIDLLTTYFVLKMKRIELICVLYLGV